MLTKKTLTMATVLLTVVYFVLLWFLLPPELVEPHATSELFLAMKIGFLSITAAITTALVLIIIYKKDFIKWQLHSFNRFKHLLRLLIKRDFVSKYRKSVLGVLWSLLNPLLTMLVMTFVFSYLFRRQIENFPVYLLSGQLIFGFFSESTKMAMNAIVAHEGLIKKVYIPKYIFPLSRVLSSLVNLAFSFLAFMLVFIFTGVQFRWTMLLLPIPVLYTFVFSLGVSMLLSALMVFFRDLKYLYGIFITMLTYLSTIFYPVDIIPERVRPLMGLNPLYHFISYYRNLAMYGIIPDLWENLVCMGFSLAALCVGLYVFMNKQDRYILYL